MDTCAICQKPVDADDAVEVTQHVADATHWSPAEYEELTVHATCLQAARDEDDRPDPNAK